MANDYLWGVWHDREDFKELLRELEERLKKKRIVVPSGPNGLMCR